MFKFKMILSEIERRKISTEKFKNTKKFFFTNAWKVNWKTQKIIIFYIELEKCRWTTWMNEIKKTTFVPSICAGLVGDTIGKFNKCLNVCWRLFSIFLIGENHDEKLIYWNWIWSKKMKIIQEFGRFNLDDMIQTLMR